MANIKKTLTFWILSFGFFLWFIFFILFLYSYFQNSCKENTNIGTEKEHKLASYYTEYFVAKENKLGLMMCITTTKMVDILGELCNGDKKSYCTELLKWTETNKIICAFCKIYPDKC